jgi:hypothetical protein
VGFTMRVLYCVCSLTVRVHNYVSHESDEDILYVMFNVGALTASHRTHRTDRTNRISVRSERLLVRIEFF